MVMQRRCASAGIVQNPSATERNLVNTRLSYDDSKTIISPRHNPTIYDRLADKDSLLSSFQLECLSSPRPSAAQLNSLASSQADKALVLSAAFRRDCASVPSLVRAPCESYCQPPSVGAPEKLPTPTNVISSSDLITPLSSASQQSTAPSSASSLDVSLNLTAEAKASQPRQYSYVDSLVDVATLIVDGLWPSVAKHGRAAQPVKLLSYFITETSRKSKTSLSTMQLTLFYCIKYKRQQLIRMEALKNMPAGSDEVVATVGSTCARRNFLSALILASKFLQDRNFSNKAWSKISSVPVNEINTREREFLEMTNWALEVKQDLFRGWSDAMDSIIKDIRITAMSDESRACHFRWRQVVRKMSTVSESQMRQLIDTLSENHRLAMSAEFQLPTPLLSPTEEKIRPRFDVLSASAPMLCTVTKVDPISCKFFDEFVQTTPRQPCGTPSDAQFHYLTPESIQTTSPANSEESYHSSSSVGVMKYMTASHGLLTPEMSYPRGMKRAISGTQPSVDVKRLRI